MEKWEEGYYITAMAGSTGGSSLVVMSKGTPYTQQSYKARHLCQCSVTQLMVRDVPESSCCRPGSHFPERLCSKVKLCRTIRHCYCVWFTV